MHGGVIVSEEDSATRHARHYTARGVRGARAVFTARRPAKSDARQSPTRFNATPTPAVFEQFATFQVSVVLALIGPA